jgi:type I restriction enzyme S subunit
MQLGEITEPKIDQSGPLPTGEFTYIDISSVDNRTKRIVEAKRMPAESAPSRARQRLRSGDVLVSMTRPNLNAVALVPPELDGAVGSTGFHVLRARDNVLPQWLYYGVQTRQFVGAMSELVQGALYPAVRPKDIRAFDLPMPALDDQRRIVAEIEKQFSRLDEAIANLKRVKANLRRYKAAVLNAAIEGRLVPTEAELALREGRTFETAAEHLGRLLGARTDRRHGQVSEKAWGKEATSDLPVLSKGWCWSSFEAVADRVTVGHVGPMQNEYVAEGIPFLRSQNVRPNRYDREGLKFISPSFHSKLQKSALEPGDVLVVRSGSVGVACVVPGSLPVANCSDLVIIKRPRGVLPKYGAFYLNAVVDSRIAAGRVGVALAHFNTKSVANLPVPVPPLPEQSRIVAEVDRRLSIVREVEAEAEANLRRAQMLRQATLAGAFAPLSVSHPNPDAGN